MLIFSRWHEKSNLNEYNKRYDYNEKRYWIFKIGSK